MISAGDSVTFRLPSAINDENAVTSYATGEYAYAVYCLSDATVTVYGGILTPDSGTPAAFTEPIAGVELSLSAGMTIYGKFRSISVTGTDAKILAYV